MNNLSRVENLDTSTLMRIKAGPDFDCKPSRVKKDELEDYDAVEISIYDYKLKTIECRKHPTLKKFSNIFKDGFAKAGQVKWDDINNIRIEFYKTSKIYKIDRLHRMTCPFCSKSSVISDININRQRETKNYAKRIVLPYENDRPMENVILKCPKCKEIIYSRDLPIYYAGDIIETYNSNVKRRKVKDGKKVKRKGFKIPTKIRRG